MKKLHSILLGVCLVLTLGSTAFTAALVRNPQMLQAEPSSPPIGYVSAPLRGIPVGRFLAPPTVQAISPIIAAVGRQQGGVPDPYTPGDGTWNLDPDGDGDNQFGFTTSSGSGLLNVGGGAGTTTLELGLVTGSYTGLRTDTGDLTLGAPAGSSVVMSEDGSGQSDDFIFSDDGTRAYMAFGGAAGVSLDLADDTTADLTLTESGTDGVQLLSPGPVVIQGSSSGVTLKSTATFSVNTQSSYPVWANSSGTQTAVWRLGDSWATYRWGTTVDAIHADDADEHTIGDTGDANPATLTLQPLTSWVEITCNDADTCDITMQETNAVEGMRFCAVNLSANVVDFADTSGVSELAGAFAAGQYDTICMRYTGEAWIEVSRSNN